jgi:hypothetical protein
VRAVEMLEATGNTAIVEHTLLKIIHSFYAMPLATVSSYCNKMINHYEATGKTASKDAFHFYMLCGTIYDKHYSPLIAPTYFTKAASQDEAPSLMSQYGKADHYQMIASYYKHNYAFEQADAYFDHAEKQAHLDTFPLSSWPAESLLQRGRLYHDWAEQDAHYRSLAVQYLELVEKAPLKEKDPAMALLVKGEAVILLAHQHPEESAAYLTKVVTAINTLAAEENTLFLSKMLEQSYHAAMITHYAIKEDLAQAERELTFTLNTMEAPNEKAQLLATTALRYEEVAHATGNVSLHNAALDATEKAAQLASTIEAQCLRLLHCAIQHKLDPSDARTLYYHCHRAQIDDTMPEDWFANSAAPDYCGMEMREEL